MGLRYSASTSSTAPASTTTGPSPTSTSADPDPSRGCVRAWGKCGGRSHTGPVCCVAGHTCEFQNPWYSQCKPTSSLLEGGHLRRGYHASKSRRHNFMGPALIQSNARLEQVPTAEASEPRHEL